MKKFLLTLKDLLPNKKSRRKAKKRLLNLFK